MIGGGTANMVSFPLATDGDLDHLVTCEPACCEFLRNALMDYFAASPKDKARIRSVVLALGERMEASMVKLLSGAQGWVVSSMHEACILSVEKGLFPSKCGHRGRARLCLVYFVGS